MEMVPWKDICDCDVADKKCLALFRDGLRRWKEHAVGTDGHSIQNQIWALLWDDAVFRTFNEARRLHIKTRDPSTGYYGTVIRLLDKSFVTCQVMAIRRLMDRHHHDPCRAVVSLPTIMAEIEEATQLHTRENYVCYDGTPYTDKQATDEDVRAIVRWRHRNYDLLAGCSDAKRSRSDRIRPDVFASLNRDHREFEILQTYANKYLAHAADPDNMRNAQDVPSQVSFRKFDECYRALFGIASAVGVLIDECIPCMVPVPSYDQLNDWDKPIVTTADRDKLRQYWHDRAGEIDRWGEEAKFENREQPGNRT